MDTDNDTSPRFSDDALIAEPHWETKWIAAKGTFDPAYERTTAALRRWVDGMEAAFVKQPARRQRRVPATR